MSLEAFPIVAQSVQTQNLVDLSLSGNTAGALALMSSGTVTIAGGNNVTLSQAGNAFTISAFNQSVQTQNNVDVTLSGNTSGALALVSSGTLTIAGGNNITLSQAGNAVTISGPNTVAQSVQTQNVVDVTLSGNTSGALALISSGTMTLAGGNNITLSQAGNAVTISGAASAAQTVQTQNLFDLTLSGNTSGTLALVSSGTLTLAGGNNVTLSQVGNAVTISAFNQSVQTQNLVDVTLAGNTSGALALVSSGTLTLAGGNNITLSQAGNAVTISAFSQTVQTQNVVDVTLAGNTSGALALVSSGTLTLAGGNNITLSQAGNAVTISAAAGAAPVLSFFNNITGGAPDFVDTVQNQAQLFPLNGNFFFQGNMTVQTARLHFSCLMSATNASTQAHTYTVLFGLYTINASTLSLFNSVSSSFGNAAASAISSRYNGYRWLTFNSTQFSNSSLTLGFGSNYIAAVLMRSSGTNHAFRFLGKSVGDFGGTNSGTIGTSVANTSSLAYVWPVLGQISTTGALPASIAVTDVTKTGNIFNYIFEVQFDNMFSAF